MACSLCSRRVILAPRSLLRRSFVGNAVSGRVIRQKDIAHRAGQVDTNASVYYGERFSFHTMCLGGLSISDVAREVLVAPVASKDVEVLSTGEKVASVEECKRRLNIAFGEAGWACTQVSDLSMACQVDSALSPLVEHALFVNGQLVAQVFGHSLSPLTPTGTKGKIYPFIPPQLQRELAPETKIVALQRCCRSLGIGDQFLGRTAS